MVVRGSVAPCHEASVPPRRRGNTGSQMSPNSTPLRAPTSDRPGDRHTGEAQGPEVAFVLESAGRSHPYPAPAIGHADPLRVRPWSAARQAAAQERHAAGVSVDAAADLAPDTDVHVLDPGLPLAI